PVITATSGRAEYASMTALRLAALSRSKGRIPVSPTRWVSLRCASRIVDPRLTNPSSWSQVTTSFGTPCPSGAGPKRRPAQLPHDAHHVVPAPGCTPDRRLPDD